MPQRYEGNSSENVPSPISIKAVLRASRRYWWLILALWTVGSAGIGAGVYLKVKPVFRAASWLKVEPTVLDLYGGSSREGSEPYMQTHVELIKSADVLSAAALSDKVEKWPRIKEAGDAVQELGRSIQVAIKPGTHLIEVSMVSQSALEAADLVNAVVEQFLVANRGWSSKATKVQIEKLSKYNDKLVADIAKTTEQLKDKHARVQVKEKLTRLPFDPETKAAKPEQGSAEWTVDEYHQMLKQANAAKMDLLQAESALSEAENVAQELSRESAMLGNKPRANSSLEAKLRADPDLRELARQRDDANQRKMQIGRSVRDSADAALVKALAKVKDIDQRFNQLREQKKTFYQEELETGGLGESRPEAEVAKMASIVKGLNLKKNTLERELNKLKLENIKQQGEELEIRFLEEDRASWKGMQDVVIRRLEQLNLDSVAEERIRMVNAARAEGRPIADKRMQYMAMAPVGVLGVVLGLVILLEIRSGRVADTEVLASRMRHEVFAIAPLPSNRPGMLETGDKAEQRLARFVQSLDHLRVALCEGGTNGEGRVVMITSATGGEGKTTLSAHLAARCANAGTSTLLIDADLRRTSLGRLLDVTPGPGLGDVLAGNAELDATLLTVQAGGFHFLSAGTPGIDPTRVLKSTRLAELIGQLRQMYDLVIIDTPPVLPVADALIMGRWADGAVMAARYDASRLPLVERANRQIIAAGIPVLGVVVNGVKSQDQAYGSYAYSYSYPGSQDPAADSAGYDDRLDAVDDPAVVS